MLGDAGSAEHVRVSSAEMIIRTMKDACCEIQRLRRQNELLQAKVDVMELFKATLTANVPQQGMVSSPDVVYSMENAIDTLNARFKLEPKPVQVPEPLDANPSPSAYPRTIR